MSFSDVKQSLNTFYEQIDMDGANAVYSDWFIAATNIRYVGLIVKSAVLTADLTISLEGSYERDGETITLVSSVGTVSAGSNILVYFSTPVWQTPVAFYRYKFTPATAEGTGEKAELWLRR